MKEEKYCCHVCALATGQSQELSPILIVSGDIQANDSLPLIFQFVLCNSILTYDMVFISTQRLRGPFISFFRFYEQL